MADKTVWCIHTTDDELFQTENLIAIGWREVGDLSKIQNDREAFKAKYLSAYENKNARQAATDAPKLQHFAYDMLQGDYVVYPSKNDKQIYIGEIIGSYYFESAKDAELPNRRKVKWLKKLPRTVFAQEALNEAGSFSTLYVIKNHTVEFLSALNKNFSSDTNADANIISAESIRLNTADFVIAALKEKCAGYALEPFVANLLEAMGYKTKVSKHGGDRGIDIVAYKDELPPRIIVQVKSEKGAISEKYAQQLKGAMNEGDYGLFVSLSGYTNNAKKFFGENPKIKGIDGYDLAELIFKYYDNLSDNYKDILPLKKVYVPNPEE